MDKKKRSNIIFGIATVVFIMLYFAAGIFAPRAYHTLQVPALTKLH